MAAAKEPLRGYPIPDEGNTVAGEFPRTRNAIILIAKDVDAVLKALAGKAPATHLHAINDITGLQAVLDGKADAGSKSRLASLGDVDVSSASNYMVLASINGKWQSWAIDANNIKNLDQAIANTKIEAANIRNLGPTVAAATAPQFKDVTSDITLTPADSGSVLRFLGEAGLKGPATVTLYDPRKGGAGQYAFCNASQHPITIKNPTAWMWCGKNGAVDYTLRPGVYAVVVGAATGTGDWFVIEAGAGFDGKWDSLINKPPLVKSFNDLADRPDIDRRAGSYKSFVFLGATTALEPRHFGCFIQFGGGVTDTLTLPKANAFEANNKGEGASLITIQNYVGLVDLPIKAPDDNFIYWSQGGLYGSGNKELKLPPNHTIVMLARGNKEWNPVGGSWFDAMALKSVARTGSYNDLTDRPDISGMERAKTVRLGELKSVSVGDASMTNRELSAGSIITGITTTVQGLKHGAFTYPNGFYYRELQQADKEGNWYVVKTL